MDKNELLRRLPKVDALLESTPIKEAVARYGNQPVADAIREKIDAIRQRLLRDPSEQALKEGVDGIIQDVLTLVEERKRTNLTKVVNATGVVLHTNLGRAPLPTEATQRLLEQMNGYMNLEYDLQDGSRGERYSHFEQLICSVTGAEAAMAVNNNAAAALLMVSAVGAGKDVVVSRGEQIEIGGKFRIPDIIDQSGAHRVEVGTTNKTRIEDYQNAISDNTGAFLKVHNSNYTILGFTQSVTRQDLVALGNAHHIPVIEDLGSGVLVDLSKFGIRKEPTVQESVAAGVDVICFSGDKLLGGPQAGILVGKKEWIDRCKKHPLTRAMRIDKCTASMLETVFSMYEDEAYAIKHIPVLSMLSATKLELEQRAERFIQRIQNNVPDDCNIQLIYCKNPVGGGSLPGETLQSVAVAVKSQSVKAKELAKQLRLGKTPVIVRVEEEHVLFDMRTLAEEEVELTTNALLDALYVLRRDPRKWEES